MQGYESYDKSKLENTTEEEVQTKVRLTALMTLGTRSTHELKFSEVQQALGLGNDSEVEAWVVRAIGKVGYPPSVKYLACMTEVSRTHLVILHCTVHCAVPDWYGRKT